MKVVHDGKTPCLCPWDLMGGHLTLLYLQLFKKLRFNWHITLYYFHVCNMMIQYMYIL